MAALDGGHKRVRSESAGWGNLMRRIKPFAYVGRSLAPSRGSHVVIHARNIQKYDRECDLNDFRSADSANSRIAVRTVENTIKRYLRNGRCKNDATCAATAANRQSRQSMSTCDEKRRKICHINAIKSREIFFLLSLCLLCLSVNLSIYLFFVIIIVTERVHVFRVRKIPRGLARVSLPFV